MEGMVVRIGLAEGGEQACWGGEQVWRGVARCGAALAAAGGSLTTRVREELAGRGRVDVLRKKIGVKLIFQCELEV